MIVYLYGLLLPREESIANRLVCLVFAANIFLRVAVAKAGSRQLFGSMAKRPLL